MKYIVKNPMGKFLQDSGLLSNGPGNFGPKATAYVFKSKADAKADLFAEYGVTGHPKANAAYALAHEYRHSSGRREVVDCFEDLVKLIT